jgi:hypothetical protein
VCPQQKEKQEALHKCNCQRIAEFLDNRLDPKYILRADEFGLHSFQQQQWRWAKKGAEVPGTS